jgi:hypothetical protein
MSREKPPSGHLRAWGRLGRAIAGAAVITWLPGVAEKQEKYGASQ